MNPVRVVLVDDHAIVRQGLRSILDPDPRFEVVGEATNGSEALGVVVEQQPDVVLLDLKLPDMSGVEVCRRIVQFNPQTAVLVLTAFIDQNLVDVCLRAGARGYLLKDAENLHLQEEVLSVMEGHIVLARCTTDVMTDHVQEQKGALGALSAQEVEILRLIARGLTNSEIGNRLHLREDTIEGRLRGILIKMGAGSRIEAVVLAQRRGFL